MAVYPGKRRYSIAIDVQKGIALDGVAERVRFDGEPFDAPTHELELSFRITTIEIYPTLFPMEKMALIADLADMLGAEVRFIEKREDGS